MGRFKSLVDSERGIESFRAWYRIPLGVGIRYCKEGEWHEKRQKGEVVIPMIAFIEGGMRIPMGTVTKDNLRAHRLAPTQCALDMFRILGCVDVLNERMGLNLTHHDVNWIYNLHHLTGQGYYLKSSVRDRAPGPYFYGMLGQTHVNGWSRVIASQNGGSTSYIFPLRLGVLQWSRHLFNYLDK